MDRISQIGNNYGYRFLDVMRKLFKCSLSYIIAEKFSSIQNEYDPLNAEDISIPPFTEENSHILTCTSVANSLSAEDKQGYTIPGDFPAKLTKIFAAYHAEPFADIINTSVKRREYPKI